MKSGLSVAIKSPPQSPFGSEEAEGKAEGEGREKGAGNTMPEGGQTEAGLPIDKKITIAGGARPSQTVLCI